ncbi:MAG: PAS domain-containing protein [Acidobacteriota bacterium]
MKSPRILVVEDESIVAEQLLGSLHRLGYETMQPVATGEDALILAGEQKPDLVLMDMELMGELNGVETAQEIRSVSEVPVVFITGFADNEAIEQVSRSEPYGYIVKPFKEEELHAAIEVALSRRHADDRLEEAVRKRTWELAELNAALQRDIEERKAAEKALQESEWRYRRVSDFMLDMASVVNNASDMILIVTPEGVIRYGTPSIGQHLLYEPPQFLGKNLSEFLCPGERAAVMSVIAEVVSTHTAHPVTHCLKKKDGTMMYVDSIIKFYIDHLNAKCALVTSRDITERKKADDALRAAYETMEARVKERTAQLAEANHALQLSSERCRRILDAVTDYIYTVEVENKQPVRTTHHSACVAITGYTVEEFEANPFLWLEMVHPDDKDEVSRHAERILEGAEEGPIRHRIIRKDGTVHWVLNTSVPYKDENGTLRSYDGVINDLGPA